MRAPFRWLGVVASLAVAAAGCNRLEAERRAPASPSLLLVTIDTLRADHVGAYGAEGAATPTLDALAAHGTRFATAIASAPLTLPSHASILTGLYPPRLGVRHNGVYRVPADAETLAERLHGAGFATGAVVGAFVLAARFGLSQGFEVYDDEMSTETAGPGGYLERRAERVADRAVAWLATARRPFFLWLHFYDPHATYRPPAPFDARFEGRPYDGEIAYVDAQLARVLAALRDTGELERTLVAVTADHGEGLGEHDDPDHGYSLYDAVLAVPLILRGPGVPAGRVVTELARTVDLAPTLLALLGQPPLSDVDGAELRPLWQDGAPRAPRTAYAETLATEIEVGWSPLFAIRDPGFLYVRAPHPELYAVASDPRQLVNLLETRSDEATAVAGRLGLELDAVLARTRASAPQALDADTLARLQALGYALPAGPVPERRADEAPVDPKDGRRAMKWLVAANAAYHEDRPDALELLERTVREMPRSSRAHALLGFQHLHSGDAARARTHLEEAVRLNPLSGYYRAMLGETKRALGDADGALADYRAAAALDPDEPYAWVGLMWHAARRGDFATAERNAGQAAAVAAANAVVRVRIGEVWETFGQYGQAGAAFESAVRIDPALEYAQMRLAVVLARFGRVADSDRHRERAGALARDPWLQSRLALAHAASGDAERAESLLGELLEREPGYEPAKRALARVRHRREERGEGTTEAGPS